MASNSKQSLGRRNLPLPAKIVIVLFAIIMAFSMMLPSLASFFSQGSTEEQAAQASDDATTSDAAAGTDSAGELASDGTATAEADAILADVPDNESLKSLAEQYAGDVQRFSDRLAEDPNNLAALLNLGQVYMRWGYSASYSGTTDEEKAYANGLIDTAISYFDKYLALNDANAVKVDLALCKSYQGDNDGAIKDLEQIVKDAPDYALAWANLGMLYESNWDTQKATEAYGKAVETDPDDEYGAKSYANQRLISLNSTVDSPGDAGDASADDISTGAESGLTSTLATDSGVGF